MTLQRAIRTSAKLYKPFRRADWARRGDLTVYLARRGEEGEDIADTIMCLMGKGLSWGTEWQVQGSDGFDLFMVEWVLATDWEICEDFPLEKMPGKLSG